MTRVADASMNVAPPNLDTPGAGKVGQNRSGLPVQLSNLRQWNPARPGTPAPLTRIVGSRLGLPQGLDGCDCVLGIFAIVR
jgi:hypothetical protein